MLFHASIAADDPERVARVIGEIWRGHHGPFYNSFIAWAGDDRGTQIEVYSRGAEIVPDSSAMSMGRNPSPSSYSPTHFAVATPLTEEEIYALAKREGWIARKCDRGGAFNVIEFWLENKFMLELLTEVEQARYKALWQNPRIGEILRGISTARQP